MKSLFLHDFQSSFYLWTDHIIAEKAETFHLASGQVLTRTNDARISGMYSYQSKRKPWVADTSLIPNKVTGVYVSGILTSTTGMHVDYKNGRILSATNLGANISGSFYYNEIGIDLNASTEESIIFENKYIDNARFYTNTGQAAKPYDYVTPIVFLSVDHVENIPFAFGGEDESKIFAKAIIVCENDFQREGLLSVFTDASSTSFPSITSEDFPYNEYFDTTGDYNFENLKTSAANNVYMIDKVKAARLSRSTQTQIPQNLSIGFVDFQICKYRYPRA